MKDSLSINDMLDTLAADPAQIEAFNENPRVFMIGFGLSPQDRHTVLEFIADNPWEAQEFFQRQAYDASEEMALKFIC